MHTTSFVYRIFHFRWHRALGIAFVNLCHANRNGDGSVDGERNRECRKTRYYFLHVVLLIVCDFAAAKQKKKYSQISTTKHTDSFSTIRQYKIALSYSGSSVSWWKCRTDSIYHSTLRALVYKISEVTENDTNAVIKYVQTYSDQTPYRILNTHSANRMATYTKRSTKFTVEQCAKNTWMVSIEEICRPNTREML